MLINDIKKDTKIQFIRSGVTQDEVGKRMGLSKQSVYQAISGKIINKTYIAIMEAAGYDIEIVFHKRGE